MQLGLAFSTIYLSNGMLLPSDPYFVRKKKTGKKRQILLLPAMQYRLSRAVHPVVIKSQHNVGIVTWL